MDIKLTFLDVFEENGIVGTCIAFDLVHNETKKHIRFEALINFKVENEKITESWGYWPDREIEDKLK